MKKLSFLFCIIIITILTLSLCVACSGGPAEPTEPTQPTESEQPAEQVVLRLTLVQPPMDPIGAETIAMGERFNERAGDAYKIEVYPAEQLAKYTETMDAVRTGAVEMANIGLGGFANSLITLTAAEIPFLYNTPEANAEVVAQLPEILDEELQTNLNVKPLGVFQPEPIEIVSNKSVRTLDDWKGLNVAGATYYGPELVKVLGGSPVFVPFPDFYSSLEKGVVDAILDAPSFTVTGKIYEVATYQTFSMALGSSHGFIVNVDVWNAMPAEIQDILMDEAKTAAANLNQTMLDMFYSDSEFCAEQGIEQYFLPKAERDKWIEKASSFIAEQEALMGDIGQQIKQLANEANEKYPYPY